MKKLTCSQLGGGDCQEVFEGNTLEEIEQKGKTHVMSAPKHADLVKKMEDATQEEKEQWWAMARELWNKTPDA